MAIGKKDAIDTRLAKMYFDKVTVNLDQHERTSPDDFWNQMQMIATVNRAVMNYRVKQR